MNNSLVCTITLMAAWDEQWKNYVDGFINVYHNEFRREDKKGGKERHNPEKRRF